MAEQMRPASNEQAPDPSNNYERSHPEREAGMGRLDNNTNTTPRPQSDHMKRAVDNAQNPANSLNAQENDQVPQPDHSMKDEEPLGWDQAPTDITDPMQKRHSRTGGKGGTPDVGDENRTG